MQMMLIQKGLAINIEHISVVRATRDAVCITLTDGIEYLVSRPDQETWSSAEVFDWVTKSLLGQI